jgi:hypothetical protein
VAVKITRIFSMLAFHSDDGFSGKKWQTTAKAEDSQNPCKQGESAIVSDSKNPAPDLEGSCSIQLSCGRIVPYNLPTSAAAAS